MELSADLWSRLPFKDLQERVLSFLPVPDLCRCRIVCKRWNQLISTPEFGALCARNAAKGDPGFIVIRYERNCESPATSSDEKSPEENPTGSPRGSPPPSEEKTPAGCCFLNLKTRRWHIVEDDDKKHGLKLYSEVVGMDGGLVCQYSFTTCEGNSIVVYNPIAKTLRKILPSQDHRTSHCLPPELHLEVDSTSQSFKLFLINHNFDDRELLADPETSQEVRNHLLNDPLVRMYDSTSDEWKSLTNPSCIQSTVTDVCSAMFQGYLYVLVGGSYPGSHLLWRYSFSEDAWDNLAMSMPGRIMIPQLLVNDNRLFVVAWWLEQVKISFNGLSRECRFEVSEIKVGDLAQETLFRMSNAKVIKHFSIETERVQSDFCPIIASGFRKNSLLFIAKSSRKPMLYNLERRKWSKLPQIPLGCIHDEDYFWAGKPMNLILPSTPW